LGIGALPMKSNLLLFACPEMHISSGHRPILWAFGGNSSVNCGFANMGMKRFHCVYCNARNKMFYSPDNKTINANMEQDPANLCWQKVKTAGRLLPEYISFVFAAGN